jgi:hypothetical protein
MPLFEWNSSASSSGATGHFWIYWAATIPATISVLVVWRLWYVFDEWRWSCEKKGSVYQDLWAWLSSSSSSKSGKTDLESGGELVKIFEN